jgi:hypothetical protein
VTFQRTAPRKRFLVLLALALVGLAVRYVVIGLPTSTAALPRLIGKTSQGANFHITLGDDGRVLATRTRIAASCSHNQSFSTGWLAVDRHAVRFARQGRSFTTRRYVEYRWAGRGIAHLAMTLRGTFTGRHSAQGTVRLVARFYDGETESFACDSRDVAWAVGDNSTQSLPHVALGRTVGHYYPSVPSLAGRVTARQQRFIDQADAICSKAIPSAPQIDDRLVFQRLSKAVQRLGAPRDDRANYGSWLDHIRHDAGLGVEYGWATNNQLAQLFGLRRCSSYGDRTPVPILSDGQPRPLP